MKRLFSVMMLAVVATLTFAFTTPKSSTLAGDTYHLSGGQWVLGPGSNCNFSAALCEFTTVQDVDDAALVDIASQAPAFPATSYTATGIDHDNDPLTADVSINVTSIKRFQ